MLNPKECSCFLTVIFVNQTYLTKILSNPTSEINTMGRITKHVQMSDTTSDPNCKVNLTQTST